MQKEAQQNQYLLQPSAHKVTQEPEIGKFGPPRLGKARIAAYERPEWYRTPEFLVGRRKQRGGRGAASQVSLSASRY
jgi:hypothetical protein